MGERKWSIYLSGEIHSDWRERISEGVIDADLPIDIYAPVTVHKDSDDCGAVIFGDEAESFWHDRKGAQLNSVRTRRLIELSDVVIVRFGEKYRQWNAAFDAGYAAALGKPIITLHPHELDHALKEVDAAASAVARTPEQVVQALVYVVRGELPDATTGARMAR